MKLIFSTLLLASSFAMAHAQNMTSTSWVCVARGYSSAPLTKWHEVHGDYKDTKEEAHDDALGKCEAQLSACRPAGCWQVKATYQP